MRGKFAARLELLLGRPLTAAEREAFRGDAHAGLWETSLLLRIRPDLVDAVRSSLPPVRFTLLEALKKNYPLRLGNKMGYIGAPGGATAEWGEVARQLLLDVVWEVVRPVLDAPGESWQQTSFLYKVPVFRTGVPYAAAAGAATLLAALAWYWWFC